MMTWVLAYLSGSSIGRYAAMALIITGLVLLIVWRIYASGANKEKARQAEASLKAKLERIKNDEEIGNLSAAERRKRLDDWVQ